MEKGQEMLHIIGWDYFVFYKFEMFQLEGILFIIN